MHLLLSSLAYSLLILQCQTFHCKPDHHFLFKFPHSQSSSQVSLAFHQIARSTGPIFTVLAYRCLFHRHYQISTYLAVVAMSVGIGMVTYGDYHFTTLGFCLTFLGLLLATIKVCQLFNPFQCNQDLCLSRPLRPIY